MTQSPRLQIPARRPARTLPREAQPTSGLASTPSSSSEAPSPTLPTTTSRPPNRPHVSRLFSSFFPSYVFITSFLYFFPPPFREVVEIFFWYAVGISKIDLGGRQDASITQWSKWSRQGHAACSFPALTCVQFPNHLGPNGFI